MAVLASAQGGGRRGRNAAGVVSSAVVYMQKSRSMAVQEDAKSTAGVLCLQTDVRSGFSSVVDGPCLNRCCGSTLTHPKVSTKLPLV
jgi:hypothetical protein